VTWRPRETLPSIRLAWPASGALYRVDPDGVVRVSPDGGGEWEIRGRVDGETQALAAANERVLYAADVNGVVRVSRDGGASWSTFAEP
jgi:hypothetical protein